MCCLEANVQSISPLPLCYYAGEYCICYRLVAYVGHVSLVKSYDTRGTVLPFDLLRGLIFDRRDKLMTLQ